MIKSKKADSLVWIIIWVFILSFALIGIINILTYNKNVTSNFEENIYNYLIDTNWDNIVKKLNTNIVQYNEVFYIHKDEINKKFVIYTWSDNEEYAYIDKLWKKVLKEDNLWKTYKRVFTNKTDVLRHEIKPNEISNLALHFDAKNIDWTNNSSLNNLDQIETWKDLSWNNNNWFQTDINKRPIYSWTWIYVNPILKFDWDKALIISNTWVLNDDSNVWTNILYDEKSFAIVFKTWFDTSSLQNIYEQWDINKWYSIQINSWKLYAWVWNSWWDIWHQYKSINISDIIPETIYFIVITQESNNADDSLNKLKIYLNWELSAEIDHVDPQSEHDWWIWLGAIYDDSYDLQNSIWIWVSENSNYFIWGWIWELAIWNHALTKNEVRWINNYFTTKWLNENEHIKYNVITNKTIKYNH